MLFGMKTGNNILGSPYLIQSLYGLLVLPVLLGEGGQVDLLAGQQMECVLHQQLGRESSVQSWYLTPLQKLTTVCLKSLDPFCIVSYDIKWVTSSWTYSSFPMNK